MVQDLYTRPKLVEFDENFAWEIMRGDSQALQIILTAEDPAGLLYPYNITGAVIKLTVRKETDTAVVITKSSLVPGNVTVLDATGLVLNLGGSVFEINFVPADTSSLLPAKYVYDVEITAMAGEVHTPIKGFVSILADVTRV